MVQSSRQVLATFYHLDVIRNKAHFILHLKTRMAGVLKDQAPRPLLEHRRFYIWVRCIHSHMRETGLNGWGIR